MVVIAVTGTPGTGKTIIAGILQKKLDSHRINVSRFITQHKLASRYDKKRTSNVVDVRKLVLALTRELKQLQKQLKNTQKMEQKIHNIVIDSHLSHYLPATQVDVCIVTKCDLKVLERRLKKRNYSKAKIRENLDAEIFDICFVEATEKKHTIEIIDTTKAITRNKKLKTIVHKVRKLNHG